MTIMWTTSVCCSICMFSKPRIKIETNILEHLKCFRKYFLTYVKVAVSLCIFKFYSKGLNVFCCDEYAKVLRIRFAWLVAAHQMTISANVISLKLCGEKTSQIRKG